MKWVITIKFVIATVTYFSEKGIDAKNFRQSVDKTKALCHLEYAKLFINNIEEDPNIAIYDCIDEEFRDLLDSKEWTADSNIEAEIIEDNSIAAKVNKLEKDLTETKLAVLEIIETSTTIE